MRKGGDNLSILLRHKILYEKKPFLQLKVDMYNITNLHNSKILSNLMLLRHETTITNHTYLIDIIGQNI